MEEYGAWEMERDRVEKELRKGQVETRRSEGDEEGEGEGEGEGEEFGDDDVEFHPLENI